LETDPDALELEAFRAEFPDFRIWREITCDRTIYNARSLHWGTNPHTVVTGNLDELRDTLRKSRAPQPGAGGQQ
jgi:hypothetical protein